MNKYMHNTGLHNAPLRVSGTGACCRALLCMWAVVLLVPAAVSATGPELTAYRVKAGFIYNFALFTTWPEQAFADANSPLELAVLEKSTQGDAFTALQNKEIQSRRLAVVPAAAAQPLPACQMLFVDTDNKTRIQRLLQEVQGRPVLTIGHTDGFAQMGGIINLYTDNKKIRFEVNLTAAKRAGLKLSSQLLKLARIVKE